MNNINLNFSIEQINLILSALGELPAKTSINLILEIKNQVEKINQNQEKTEE